MTVRELKTLRHAALALVCLAPVAALLFVPRSWWALLLLMMLALLLVMRYLLRRMLRRLDHIAYDLLDPELLNREATELQSILRRPATQKNNNFIHLYSALAHGLSGEFGRAAEDTMQIAFGQAGPDASVKWDLAHYYLRDGKLSMAGALVAQLMERVQGAPSSPSQLHTLGLFHLERGEHRQAGERLREALERAGNNLVRLNCHYDLARLMEAQGDGERALAHYRATAALGPDVWLGRQAAEKCGGLGNVPPECGNPSQQT